MKTNRFIPRVCILLTALFAFGGCTRPGDTFVTQALDAYNVKDYDRALPLFEKALQAENKYSKDILYGYIASIYVKQEDWQNAASYQEKALSERPDYRGYISLAMLYRAAKQTENAEDAYKRAIMLNPKAGEAYASLATMYLDAQDAEKAYELLEKAIELSPKLAVAYANLAVACAMLGSEDESNAALLKAKELKCPNLDAFSARVAELLESAKEASR